MEAEGQRCSHEPGHAGSHWQLGKARNRFCPGAPGRAAMLTPRKIPFGPLAPEL